MFFFDASRVSHTRRATQYILFLILSSATAALGQEWAEFADQTADRLIADPEIGIDDQEEKDYAWGDVDNDGDTDLVVVRKQPWSGTGRRRNVLFMNESGVLVDRTVEYATAADDGGQGFLDPTNDRDVVLTDVNGDGWLDIVTAVTLGDGLPKTISHPRVYINLGEDDGEWQGYRYEEGRIPQLHKTAGPWFNAVAAGDVTGDGLPDLYFVESAWDGAEQSYDFNDRLLINDGAGFFIDESTLRMTEEMLDSVVAVATAICDMNDDGASDVVKAALPLEGLTIAYNDPANIGNFLALDTLYTYVPTHVSVGDLNQDQRPDLVATDDGLDRYLLNMGDGPDGYADFSVATFPDSSGFGGNSVIADLNDDGWQDVIITDVDFIISGCSRTTGIYRSSGGDPPSFIEVDVGIPEASLQGWHDAAVFDVNGDGLLDIVAGRCTGTQVWVQQLPIVADLDGDGDVDAADLALLLGNWGPCADPDDCPADLDGDGSVGASDLAILLGNWG